MEEKKKRVRRKYSEELKQDAVRLVFKVELPRLRIKAAKRDSGSTLKRAGKSVA